RYGRTYFDRLQDTNGFLPTSNYKILKIGTVRQIFLKGIEQFLLNLHIYFYTLRLNFVGGGNLHLIGFPESLHIGTASKNDIQFRGNFGWIYRLLESYRIGTAPDKINPLLQSLGKEGKNTYNEQNTRYGIRYLSFGQEVYINIPK